MQLLPIGLGSASLLWSLCATVAAGQHPEPVTPPTLPVAGTALPVTPPPGPETVQPAVPWPAFDHTQQRAGCLPGVAWYAHPSDTGSYAGYYVGGGAPCLGEPRCPEEGTWGWDYQGWFLPRRVLLQWWHGRRYQGGSGSYRTVPTPNCSSPSTP